MLLKIDTKEKFHEISLQEAHVSANMTADMDKLLSDCQTTAPYNVVLNMEGVKQLDPECARVLVVLQNSSYEQSRSFVLCHLDPAVEEKLDEQELLELLNVVPTLSEAWDIVQMEEIERELLDGLE